MTNNSPRPSAPSGETAQSAMAELVATAYHEAGHAIMAFTLGRPVHKVTIAPAQLQTGGGRLGVCKIDRGRLKASKDSLEDEALILFAGMVAESQITSQYCEHGASLDLRAIRRLLTTRASSDRQLARLESRMLAKTEHILGDQVHTRAIELVAQELLENETISGRAVRHLFQQASQQGS